MAILSLSIPHFRKPAGNVTQTRREPGLTRVKEAKSSGGYKDTTAGNSAGIPEQTSEEGKSEQPLSGYASEQL